MIQSCRDQLVNDYWHLVRREVQHWARRYGAGWYTLADVESDAALGLLTAATAWDATRSGSFEAFARHRIRQRVIDEHRQREGRDGGRKSRLLGPVLRARSLSEIVASNPEPVSLADSIPNREQAQESDTEFWDQIFRYLPDRERQLAVGLSQGLTITEAAERIGLKQSWACKLWNLALEKLRNHCDLTPWL